MYSALPLLLPRFTGVGGYTHSIGELIDHFLDGGTPEPGQKKSATGFDLLGNEETEYEITPGGFKRTVYPRTRTAKVAWALFMVTIGILMVLACRNTQQTLLIMAETAVAGIVTSIAGWFINLFRTAETS